MNFLPGELTGSGTAVRLNAGPVIPLASGKPAGPDGHEVTIGIRPEHVSLGTLAVGQSAGGQVTVGGLPGVKLADGPLSGGQLTDRHTETAADPPPRSDTGGRSLTLCVDLVEPLGSETLIHGRLAEAPAQEMVVRVPGHAPTGERLALRLMPGQLHLFDRATGRRVPGT
jgi:sn-glycerol 3-phosphate transport system ATP-binding protein